MKILAVGGGSGGHVTPVVAVLKELRAIHPEAEIRFWCDAKFSGQAEALISSFDPNLRLDRVVSGKLRRYHHLTLIRQLMWPKLVLLNIRDAFLVGFGTIQSIIKLIIWRPDVIFAKGGFVCLPVGIAAKILNIPLAIHDSDALPGLTSRILSRWAKVIATGAPLEYYNYPADKSKYIGIPISSDFHKFTGNEVIEARNRWGINQDRPLIVITGGGLGAQRINDSVAMALEGLMRLASVVLVSGTGQYDELRSLTPENSSDFQLYPFVSEDMAGLLGAADIVLARAGATTILELAALERPTILIPNAKLTGGHQIKNAKVYSDAGAVEVIIEEDMVADPELIVKRSKALLQDKEHLLMLSRNISEFARPNAAKEMAQMIINVAGR